MNPLHEKWIKMGYDTMPPINFECAMCKLPSALREPPKANTLYRCDNCLEYYIFEILGETDAEYKVKWKRVKFKTKQLEKEWLEKHGK